MALTVTEKDGVIHICSQLQELEQQELVALLVDVMATRPDTIPVIQTLIDG
jgi:hypothetical protein